MSVFESPLRDLRILVTRSAPDAELIGAPLVELGALVEYFPLLEIEPITALTDQLDLIKKLRVGERLIFISRNAVRFSLPYLSAHSQYWPRELVLIAVGAGTAQYLADCTGQLVIYPKLQQNSEGLLALDELQQVSGERIYLMKGEGGRTLIERTLTNRGAELRALAWYRRQNSNSTARQLNNLLKINNFNIILLSSVEAAAQFARLTSEVEPMTLKSCVYLVVSDRVEKCLEGLVPDAKFIRTNGAGHKAITQALLRWVKNNKI